MKAKTKNKLELLIIALLSILFLLAGINNSKAQVLSSSTIQAIEGTYSTQDRGIGFNSFFIFNGIGAVAGYEQGVYRYGESAKVCHQKYRAGLSGLFDQDDSDCQGSFLIYAALCHNDYQQKYDLFESISDDFPALTYEVGVKYHFKGERVLLGLQYDLKHLTGGFSVGIILNKQRNSCYNF